MGSFLRDTANSRKGWKCRDYIVRTRRPHSKPGLLTGDEVMLHLDDIRHTNPGFLKNSSRSPARSRRIEDGEVLEIPDMLATAPTSTSLATRSPASKTASPPPVLPPMSSRDSRDVRLLVRMAESKPVAASSFVHDHSRATDHYVCWLHQPGVRGGFRRPWPGPRGRCPAFRERGVHRPLQRRSNDVLSGVGRSLTIVAAEALPSDKLSITDAPGLKHGPIF